ncbi:MAG: sigma-70 family RNA polymerase sigma factor [Clostridia bacterium]|nr:sigma-70 family RNA polymerase sigma factor [Clostridia bacterium]
MSGAFWDAGEEEFEKRLVACRETMFRIAFGVLRNEEDASDAVQSAFCALLKKDRTGKKLRALPPDTFRWYAFRAARNTALNLYQKNRREQERTAGLEETPLPAGEEDLAEELILKAEAETLRRAVRAMPEQYRTVLFRVCILKEKGNAVAASIGISAAALSVRLKRAKEMLKCLLEEEETP